MIRAARFNVCLNAMDHFFFTDMTNHYQSPFVAGARRFASNVPKSAFAGTTKYGGSYEVTLIPGK